MSHSKNEQIRICKQGRMWHFQRPEGFLTEELLTEGEPEEVHRVQLTQSLVAWDQSLELILCMVKGHFNRECRKRIPLPVMQVMDFRDMSGSR